MSAQLVALALEKINLKKILLCLFWAFILVLNVRFLKVYCVGIEHNFFFTWLVTYYVVPAIMYVQALLLNVIVVWLIILWAAKNVNVRTWFLILSYVLFSITAAVFYITNIDMDIDRYYSLFSQNDIYIIK